jgi:hypothetical protein
MFQLAKINNGWILKVSSIETLPDRQLQHEDTYYCGPDITVALEAIKLWETESEREAIEWISKGLREEYSD